MARAKIFLSLSLALTLLPSLVSCNQNKDSNVLYLRVLNSEDYISTSDPEDPESVDLLDKFEQEASRRYGKKVRVIYDTFDTNENMYNILSTGKTKYDLICTSDYMVQKLINNNLIVPLNHHKVPYYDNEDVVDTEDETDFDSTAVYASDFIRSKLQGVTWTYNSDNYVLDDYCECYMWGTLGILYNPNALSNVPCDEFREDMTTFANLWNPKYNKSIAIKDSMRDTYAIGLINRYRDELEAVNNDISLSKEEKLKARQVIFDRGGSEDIDAVKHINEVKEEIIKLRSNIFGFELDGGKQDIITGKIAIDTAWSGDAVWAISEALEAKEKNPNVPDLYYSIPEEGSNIWFDAWCMQDNGNSDLAYDFLNFLSRPDNVYENFCAIGYTSSIGGEDIFNYYLEYYDSGDELFIDEYDVKDLSYFFGEGSYEISVIPDGELDRKLSAQFPDIDLVDNLMVMKDYGDNNELIMKMWEEVKYESLPIWATVLLTLEIVAAVVVVGLFLFLYLKNKKNRQIRKLKNMKVTSN